MFDRWDIPARVLGDTAAAFLRGEYEVFVVWTAPLRVEGVVCPIQRCIVPGQQPGVTALGVYVRINGRELARIQYENFDRGERSVVQLHTHPSGNVRMSDLDRRWEVVGHVGALSVIVPDYGTHGLLGFPGIAAYEREDRGWRLWSSVEIARRLRVVL